MAKSIRGKYVRRTSVFKVSVTLGGSLAGNTNLSKELVSLSAEKGNSSSSADDIPMNHGLQLPT